LGVDLGPFPGLEPEPDRVRSGAARHVAQQSPKLRPILGSDVRRQGFSGQELRGHAKQDGGGPVRLPYDAAGIGYQVRVRSELEQFLVAATLAIECEMSGG